MPRHVPHIKNCRHITDLFCRTLLTLALSAVELFLSPDKSLIMNIPPRAYLLLVPDVVLSLYPVSLLHNTIVSFSIYLAEVWFSANILQHPFI